MEIPEILNFEDLLSDIIPKDKKFVRCEKTFLTAPGENYASLILGLKTVVENKENEAKEETIHSVAKLLAPSHYMRHFMNISYTVRNELAFYQTILPTLRNFEKQQGSSKSLQAFPKFHAGRLNLDKSKNTLDENAIILLENLKTEGYTLIDNTAGFDLETTKLILTQMAELHGAFIALKETQRDVFEEKLKPYFDEFPIFQMDDENECFMTSDIVVNAIVNILQEDKLCNPYMDRIRQTIQNCVSNLGLPKNSAKFREHVFASLIHDDLWVNNILVKTNLNKVVDVKLLDWQLYEYGSVVQDILFFLCSSTQEDIFRNNFDDLFKFYHESLTAVLKELKCDTEKFSFNAFQKEMKIVSGESAFFYVMMALPSIFPTGDNVVAVHEVNKERMLAQVKVSDFCRKRICLITQKFINKGWI